MSKVPGGPLGLVVMLALVLVLAVATGHMPTINTSGVSSITNGPEVDSAIMGLVEWLDLRGMAFAVLVAVIGAIMYATHLARDAGKDVMKSAGIGLVALAVIRPLAALLPHLQALIAAPPHR